MLNIGIKTSHNFHSSSGFLLSFPYNNKIFCTEYKMTMKFVILKNKIFLTKGKGLKNSKQIEYFTIAFRSSKCF